MGDIFLPERGKKAILFLCLSFFFFFFFETGLERSVLLSSLPGLGP